MGVAPIAICVAHRSVATNDRLGGAAGPAPGFSNHRGRLEGLRPVTRSWARSESNRRCVRVRTGCNPVLLRAHEAVPPPGVEPEPLGLQPSAQTTYARAGYEGRTGALEARVRPSRSSSSSSSVVRERRSPCAGRTSGVSALVVRASAPIAIPDLQSDPELRNRLFESRSSVYGGNRRTREAENDQGPLGLPGRPFSTWRVRHVRWLEDLRRYPYLRRDRS